MMNKVESAWKLPFAGAAALLLGGGVVFVSLCLNSPLFNASARTSLPDLGWINLGAPIVLFGLLTWASWSLLGELRALHRKQAELAKLSVVANKADNAVMITNRDGLIEWVNEGFSRVSGHKAADAVGKPPGSVLLGSLHNARIIQKIRDGFSHQRNFSVEMLCAHRTGHRYWLALNFTPVFNEQEQLASYIIVGTDVTGRKRAEEEVLRISRRNELLLHAAGDGICGLDVQGHISFVNPAATR